VQSIAGVSLPVSLLLARFPALKGEIHRFLSSAIYATALASGRVSFQSSLASLAGAARLPHDRLSDESNRLLSWHSYGYSQIE
jgi:hypothetical protein